MIKKSKIPTILGIIILLAGTFLGVFYLNVNQVFKIGASPQTSPKDVRISNITDVSATISWTTEGPTSGFINWGTSSGSVNKVETEGDSSEKFYTHSITLTGLSAQTDYFYKINSNGTTYDNNGIPWQLTTGGALAINKVSLPISGSVITASGQPEKRALVYLNVGGYLASTLSSDTGNFVFQLGSIRTTDLTSYAQIDPAQTLLEISVVAGPDGVASAQAFAQSAQPIPPMVLGKVQDFRSLPPNQDNQNPAANLNLPENSTPSSKFNVASSSGTPKPTSVILESLTQGETVTSTQPQFFGKGPGGETITITVHSDTAITGSVTIPGSGSWSWTPPSNLAPGAHTITLTWIDATGITRSLTRNFVVQAGELPSFAASPSGSPTASPTGTPKATPTATSTPRSTATASAAPIPVTGDLTPTLLLFTLGVLITTFSFFVWKTAET